MSESSQAENKQPVQESSAKPLEEGPRKEPSGEGAGDTSEPESEVAAESEAVESKGEDAADAPEVEPAAESEPVAAAEAAPEARAEPPVAVAAPAAVAAARTSSEMYGTLGWLAVVAGLGVAVAPFLSDKLAQVLQPLGNTQVPAGTLIVGGLVLYGVGVLRRVLHGIRGEVDYITNETLLLGQIAHDGRALQHEVDQLELGVAATRADMRGLAERMEKLTEVATDPAFETSIFRMAASLDQLGARLDVTSKERFVAMQKLLEEKVGQVQRSSESLSSKVRDLNTRVEEQDRNRRASERETMEQIEVSSACVQERVDQGVQAIERFGADLGRLEESLTRAVETSVAHSNERIDRCVQATEATGAQLGRLEESLTRVVETSVAHSNERIERCVEATERTGVELEGLEQSLSRTVEVTSERSDERIEQCVRAIEGVGQESGRTAEKLTAGLSDLSRDLIHVVADQRASFDERVGGLEREFYEWAAESRERAATAPPESEQAAYVEFESETLAASAPEPEPEVVNEPEMAVEPEAMPEPEVQVERAAESAPAAALPHSLPFGFDVPLEESAPEAAEVDLAVDAKTPVDEPRAPLPGEVSRQAPEPARDPLKGLDRKFLDGWTDW